MLFWDSYGITTFNSCKTFQSSLTVARLYNFANELHIFGPTCENVFFSLLLLVKEWILWDWVFEGLDLNLNSLLFFLAWKKHHNSLEKNITTTAVFLVFGRWHSLVQNGTSHASVIIIMSIFFTRVDISLANFFYMYIFHPINTKIIHINVVHTCETRAGTTLTDCFLWMLGWITGRKLSTTW